MIIEHENTKDSMAIIKSLVESTQRAVNSLERRVLELEKEVSELKEKK